MRVALSGATGFTGRRVVAELLRRGHEVRALVRPPSAGRDLPAELVDRIKRRHGGEDAQLAVDIERLTEILAHKGPPELSDEAT